MGLSDKFKNLTKQAQEAVAEHADKLHDAVDTVGVAVNEKTQGKYASKIAKVGEKTSGAIDKFGGTDQERPEGEAGTTSTASDGPETAASAEPSTRSETAAADASGAAEPAPSAAEPAPSAATTPPPADGFPSFDE